jgi:hypothetical protein
MMMWRERDQQNERTKASVATGNKQRVRVIEERVDWLAKRFVFAFGLVLSVRVRRLRRRPSRQRQ